MRVLLVKPAFARVLQNTVYLTYPLGLMYVAGMLRANGHEVSIWHDDVSNGKFSGPGAASFKPLRLQEPDPVEILQPLADYMDAYKPDVVGVSYTTIDRAGAHAVAKLAKTRGIRTVAGGVHPSLLPSDELGPFDGVVIGEGDTDEALWVLGANSSMESGRTEDLDQYSPARDAVVGYENYDPYLRGIIQTQRGCPYNCGYCAAPKVFGRKVRTRKPDAVAAEVASLGVSNGRIIDDSFFVNKDHSRAVCAALSGSGFSWVCDMALQDANDDALRWVRKGGGTAINVGVESASVRWRELSGKHVSEGQPEDLVKRARDKGLRVHFYFMIGFPGETVDEINATLDYAAKLKDLGATPCISLVTPYPKTRLWDLAIETKKIDNPDWSVFIHQGSTLRLADCTDAEWEAAIEKGNLVNK